MLEWAAGLQVGLCKQVSRGVSLFQLGVPWISVTLLRNRGTFGTQRRPVANLTLPGAQLTLSRLFMLRYGRAVPSISKSPCCGCTALVHAGHSASSVLCRA